MQKLGYTDTTTDSGYISSQEKGGEGRMRLDLLSITWVLVLAVTLSSARGDKVTFQEDAPEERPSGFGKDQ